jgi:hypothetical protein
VVQVEHTLQRQLATESVVATLFLVLSLPLAVVMVVALIVLRLALLVDQAAVVVKTVVVADQLEALEHLVKAMLVVVPAAFTHPVILVRVVVVEQALLVQIQS